MSQLAVLGLGARGLDWVWRIADAGHSLRVFDPDPGLQLILPKTAHRASTISQAVSDAALVIDCAPDRLALKRKLFQTAQAAMMPGTPILSTSPSFTRAKLQGCATRPEEIFSLAELDAAALTLAKALLAAK